MNKQFIAYKSRFYNIQILIFLTLTIFNNQILASEQNVFKEILDNGLTVLVRRNITMPTVYVELLYNVGSKDEQTDEKGLAHLLEHMIFKGTKELLSETDIAAITHKLSGYCNAHTHYDFTAYEFELPSRHWHEALPILADCMKNCTFKQDLLNAEFKAVIQELKMGRDNYAQVLYKELISTIFSDHPYHYPIIGFKQNIWEINSNKLMEFYKKHYLPNNATLVIIGDVDPLVAIKEAKKCFNNIPADFNYKKKEFYLNNDIIARSVTIYRDVKNSQCVVAYIVPGQKDGKTFDLDATSMVLGGGASSRLYQKLIVNADIVNNVNCYNWQIFDHGLFLISFEPKTQEDIEKIINLIKEEITNLEKNGITQLETDKIVNNLKYSYFKLLENNSAQAGAIGQSYLTTKDENKLFNYFNFDPKELSSKIKFIISNYLRSTVMHKGFILPAPEAEKNNLLELQQKDDLEDIKVLNERIRNSQVEPENYAQKIVAKPIEKYNFPKPETFTTSNGIKVLTYNNKNTPTISAVLKLKVNSTYDSKDLPGASILLNAILSKGTKNYSYQKLTQELDSRAISLNCDISSGIIYINILSSEFEKTFELLNEILTNPLFDDNEIEKERNLILSALLDESDNTSSIGNSLITKKIYNNHPYSNKELINKDNINKITKSDLIYFYKKYITPKQATLSISGDISKINIKSILEKTISKWDGPEVEDIKFPNLTATIPEAINYSLNRDQITLIMAHLTIDRNHPDYEKLIIFNQIMSGSMDSKLFKLRQKTGLFYDINASATSGSGKQPGIFYVSTIVSKDNLAQAEDLIIKTIEEISENITPEEVKQAKDKLASSLIFNYATNEAIASTFTFLQDYNYPYDYYDNRVKDFENITIDEIKDAIKKHINVNSLIKVRVGRV